MKIPLLTLNRTIILNTTGFFSPPNYNILTNLLLIQTKTKGYGKGKLYHSSYVTHPSKLW
jgi:hypothetical protein